MADSRRFALEEVVAYFQELEDPRSEINRKRPLASVGVIALIAVLAGASGPTAIAPWAAIQEGLPTAVWPLPYGVPGKDVFRRVPRAPRPEAFQACFAAWVRSSRDKAAARPKRRARPSRESDVHPTRSPERSAGAQDVAGAEVDRRGDLRGRARRQDHR